MRSPVLSSYSSKGGVNEFVGTNAERRLSRRVRSPLLLFTTFAGILLLLLLFLLAPAFGASVVASLLPPPLGAAGLAGAAGLGGACPAGAPTADPKEAVARRRRVRRPFILRAPRSRCTYVDRSRDTHAGTRTAWERPESSGQTSPLDTARSTLLQGRRKKKKHSKKCSGTWGTETTTTKTKEEARTHAHAHTENTQNRTQKTKKDRHCNTEQGKEKSETLSRLARQTTLHKMWQCSNSLPSPSHLFFHVEVGNSTMCVARQNTQPLRNGRHHSRPPTLD